MPRPKRTRYTDMIVVATIGQQRLLQLPSQLLTEAQLLGGDLVRLHVEQRPRNGPCTHGTATVPVSGCPCQLERCNVIVIAPDTRTPSQLTADEQRERELKRQMRDLRARRKGNERGPRRT